MPSVISGDANVSASEFGYLDGVTSGLQSQLDAITAVANGKILQVVRQTDGTNRSTTSTSFVDANISVTITPQDATSSILLVWAISGQHGDTSSYAQYAITDSSNNAISGAEGGRLGDNTSARVYANLVMVAYDTPATTSATTYKGRFRVAASGNAVINNTNQTGQLIALEIAA